MLLFHISSVAGARWPKGLAYNNGGPHSTSSPLQHPHPLLGGGGAWTISLSSARPNNEEGASQGAQSYKVYVSSRFVIQITASWGT